MKMKFAVYFFAIISFAIALPPGVPHEETEKGKETNPAKSAGLPDSRIIGSYELAPHGAPYQAAVLVNGNTLTSGSLISTTRVLTTAYFTFGASYAEVRLGAHYYDEEEDTQVRINSTTIITPEDYDTDKRNNIAIIILPREVTLSSYIQTVKLPEADAGTYAESWGLVSGWGKTTGASDLAAPALRGAYVRVMSNEDCAKVYGSAAILDHDLCTAGTGIVSVCAGDSGDPLVVSGVLIGFATFNGDCELGLPSGYHRVSYYRDWIDLYA